MKQEHAHKSRWLNHAGVFSCIFLGLLVFSGFFAPLGVTGTNDTLVILVDHAGFLHPGSKICFRGVPVGSITALELVNSEGRNIARAESPATTEHRRNIGLLDSAPAARQAGETTDLPSTRSCHIRAAPR